jgi:alpha-glucosidase
MMMISDWMLGVHHDGSSRYVSNPLPALGDEVIVTLRVPKSAPVKKIAVRSMPDGEAHRDFMDIVSSDAVSDFWQVAIEVSMPVNPYRFELLTDEGLVYYTGLGLHRAMMPDVFDFKLLADFQAPEWVQESVFYQIFPDRFANGDPNISPKDGEWEYQGHQVVQREWGELPKKWDKGGSLDFFGGDLVGIQQKLDYLVDLGINAIYLTPIFTSKSNHRYNIDDFYTVDKHLGGNEALSNLTSAMHTRDMKLILDITPNHTSNTGEWFTSAQHDDHSPYADFYTFHNRPDDYVAWLNVPTLPKLNYASEKLRETMYAGEDSVFRHWLRPPYNIDGWRLDVYNMTARQGNLQLNKETGQGIRKAVKQESPDAYLFGEHFFDGTPHLQGDEMDATMNYEGFNIPLWRWLAGYDGKHWLPEFSDTHRMPTEAFDAQLRNFRAAIPWVIARMQFNQLGSHDTRRILNTVHMDKALVKLGVGLLMAYPGVPCVYYGDEIGLEGAGDPDNRRCMAWDEADWDHDLRSFHQQVIALRKTSHALTQGGFQTLYADADIWAFLRESDQQRLIVVGYRGESGSELRIPVWQGGIADGAILTDSIRGRVVTVHNGEVVLQNVSHGEIAYFDVT